MLSITCIVVIGVVIFRHWSPPLNSIHAAALSHICRTWSMQKGSLSTSARNYRAAAALLRRTGGAIRPQPLSPLPRPAPLVAGLLFIGTAPSIVRAAKGPHDVGLFSFAALWLAISCHCVAILSNVSRSHSSCVWAARVLASSERRWHSSAVIGSKLPERERRATDVLARPSWRLDLSRTAAPSSNEARADYSIVGRQSALLHSHASEQSDRRHP
jgi:hypothetical protein